MKIKFASIYVDDQETALKFYRDKLGFKVKQDDAYGPDTRWLSVVSPEDESGVALLLEKASKDDGTKQFQEQLFKKGKPAASFGVADLDKQYKELTEKGVEFTSEPTERSYGGKDEVLKDGCGNLINLHQE